MILRQGCRNAPARVLSVPCAGERALAALEGGRQPLGDAARHRSPLPRGESPAGRRRGNAPARVLSVPCAGERALAAPLEGGRREPLGDAARHRGSPLPRGESPAGRRRGRAHCGPRTVFQEF